MFCRSGERCGRANFGSGVQENFRHAYPNASPEEEDRYRREKEIAEPNSKANSFANSHGKEILDAPGATIPSAIGIAVTEKETNAICGRGIAITHSKKEKDFADANAEPIAAS